jgi:hypothetical protein
MALDKYMLPTSLISEGDISRVLRELINLDNYIQQAKLRQPGTPLKRLPKTSNGLDDFSELNHLNLLLDKDRDKARVFLEKLMKNAPVVHISFAADPSAVFMTKIISWFRNNINQLTLVNIGLEPTIVAGCTVRTDNRFHDFSLRHHFDAQRQFLLSKLRESS